MKFRKDISGLRAVAVVLVILFHGGIPVFPSGFVGVDVFFVISGFLITSIVRSDLAAGTFSFSGFYVRRLWRIQVALLAVIAITLAVAAIFYLPGDFNDYFKSAMRTIGASSNYFFARTTTAYAATGSQSLLLLHTWSLSVEWQWYLVMPAMMWLLHRHASLLQARIIMSMALLVSLALALRQPVIHGDAVYYWFSSRIFEFLSGATLAVLVDGSVQQSANGQPKKAFRALFLNGLGMLALISVFAVSMRHGVISDYPNSYAVLLCVACMVLLWVGRDEETWVYRVLSLAPVVFIGDISYSLYLWHWPIFATWRYLGLSEGFASLIFCCLLAFTLAFLSYRFIEQPYRRLRLSLGRSVLLLVVVPLLIVAAAYGVARKYSFLPARFGPELARVDGVLDKYESPLRLHCLQGRATGKRVDPSYLGVCEVGAAGVPATGLMIGDSYSNQYWNFMDLLAKSAGMSVVALSTPSCLVLPGVTLDHWKSINYENYRVCENRVRQYYEIIQSHKFKYVAIGENWVYYEFAAIVNRPGDVQSVALGQQRIEEGVQRALDAITKAGAIPVIIKQLPVMPENFQNCFFQHFKLRENGNGLDCTLSSDESAAEVWYDTLFKKMKTRYPTLVVIDPRSVLCAGEYCMTENDGVPFYRDTGHMSDYGAYWLGQHWLQSQRNPFVQSAVVEGQSR